jgi:pSer/pThr/pTyr-binding forkhead associated (FHA) protein
MTRILLKYKKNVIKDIIMEKKLLTIGRKSDNDIFIDNQAVSGHHAVIKIEGDGLFIEDLNSLDGTYLEGDGLFIEDLNSLNGTFLNGQKVSKGQLYHGDVMLIGVHTLEVISDKIRGKDKRSFTIRGHSMEETVVIAPDDKKKILISTDKNIQDPLGGFIVIEGSTDSKEYQFKDRVSAIGKEKGSAIKLKGLFAPKVAALVNRRKEGYFITPSGNKELKINGKGIDHRYDLKDGDIVEVAKLKLQFYVKE